MKSKIEKKAITSCFKKENASFYDSHILDTDNNSNLGVVKKM